MEIVANPPFDVRLRVGSANLVDLAMDFPDDIGMIDMHSVIAMRDGE